MSGQFPGLGSDASALGLVPLEQTSDGRFAIGRGGVGAVARTGDGVVEFVGFESHTLAHVRSSMGYPAYYPVHPVSMDGLPRAVLMDLDGTTVHSEEFWIWIIQQSTASLLGDAKFELEEADMPHVSGHSVSEHLQHCISKYCPDKTVEEARAFYFEHTHRELAAILAGGGRPGAFTPAPGLKDFLLELKGRGIRLGLVTSGLHEKAYPEILSAFRDLGMGDPAEFYDAIITAGFPMRGGQAGTLGELSPKPHPWLYAEAARVGLGIPFEDRAGVAGIEDSAAGVCSIRLAGFTPIGLQGGNIVSGGAAGLCHSLHADLQSVRDALFA
jgi:beta-phosphoglucomutase